MLLANYGVPIFWPWNPLWRDISVQNLKWCLHACTCIAYVYDIHICDTCCNYVYTCIPILHTGIAYLYLYASQLCLHVRTCMHIHVCNTGTQYMLQLCLHVRTNIAYMSAHAYHCARRRGERWRHMGLLWRERSAFWLNVTMADEWWWLLW